VLLLAKEFEVSFIAAGVFLFVVNDKQYKYYTCGD
jgi:hypothetical protein